MGQEGCALPHLGKLGLTVNAALLPGGKDSPLTDSAPV